MYEIVMLHYLHGIDMNNSASHALGGPYGLGYL